MGVHLDQPGGTGLSSHRLQAIAADLQVLANAVGDGAWPLQCWAVHSAAPVAKDPRDRAVCLPAMTDWLFGERHIECDQIDATIRQPFSCTQQGRHLGLAALSSC